MRVAELLLLPRFGIPTLPACMWCLRLTAFAHAVTSSLAADKERRQGWAGGQGWDVSTRRVAHSLLANGEADREHESEACACVAACRKRAGLQQAAPGARPVAE